jgi:hypothetical protein
MGLLNFFRSKKLSDVLLKTYKVKVQGVLFEIRKIDPVDFIAGYKAIIQPFDTYKTKSAETKPISPEAMLTQQAKIKEHYADVFLSAVVSPKLVRNVEDNSKGIWVQNLFSDWDLASSLYEKIMEITYGKKKMKLYTSLKTKF